MPLWHDLARNLTGEALITAVATGLRGEKPRDDEHYRRRALAMLRQAHINPFARTKRPGFPHEPIVVARGQLTDLTVSAGPTSGAAVRCDSLFHAQGIN